VNAAGERLKLRCFPRIWETQLEACGSNFFLWSCTKYQTPFLILEGEKTVTISSEDI